MTSPMIMARQPHGRPKLKLNYKEDFKKMVRDKRKEKAMHGKFPTYLDKDHVDVELSFKWMKHTGLKGETEGLVTAAQDQALNTMYYCCIMPFWY